MVFTPDSSSSGELTLQEALFKLAVHAETVVKGERERDWLPLMRNKAAELGIELDVKDDELDAYLEAAERRLSPGRTYVGGDALQATESVFLLDGLVKLGEANVIIGQPKVGKSSFSTGLIAAIRDRRETFLSRDLLLPGERMPVLIFGTDQSEGDWLHFLRRETLVDEANVLDPGAVDFFCSLESSAEYNFTRDGLRHMREEIDKHQFPLVIIDSLSSMMEPTGIEENTSRYAQPIRTAIRELRKTGATLLIIHHSVKRPATWDWIVECRGSSSISSVFSWGVLMRWVAQEDDGLARLDRRVGFTGKGRGSAETGGVMAEYLADGGWTYLDGLEHAQKVERTRQKIAELGGVRGEVFDYLKLRSEAGCEVTSNEISNALPSKRTSSHVDRELENLRTRGLAVITRREQIGEARKPSKLWQVSEPVLAIDSLGDSDLGFKGLNGFSSIKTIKTKVSDSQEGVEALKKNQVPSILVRTPVERLIDGQWHNGWLVRDGSDPHHVVIEKVGNPMLTMSNQRWDIDIRPCESPFVNSVDAFPELPVESPAKINRPDLFF